MQETLLCLSCKPTVIENLVPPRQPLSGHAESRMFHWQKAVVAFWSSKPMLFRLFRLLPILLFIVAVFCAFLPTTREYTVFPLTLSVLMMVLSELIPLTPLPLNLYNTVTSSSSRYMTALGVSMATVFVLVLTSGIMAVSERFGNRVFFERSGFTEVPRSYWSDSAIPFLSAALVVAPIAYFTSLSVSENFVARVDVIAP